VALGSSAPTTAALPALAKPALASSPSSFHAASNGADDSSAFQHHKLIGSGGRLCRHLREVATMQTAALYLAPAAFLSPFEEEQHQLLSSDDDDEAVSVSRAQSYMAFLTDPTRLIANPGLRHSVRGRVGKKPGF
jgi:hypothetical protein